LFPAAQPAINLSLTVVDLQFSYIIHEISIILLLQLTLHLDTDKASGPLGFKQILITIYLVNAQP
jgi:hypothetical protein